MKNTLPTNETLDFGPWTLDNALGVSDDGWCLIAPFGEWPKTRVYREGGQVKQQKFIQVLDDQAANVLVSRENSLFGRLKRAFIGVPVFKGHGDEKEVDPQSIVPHREKIKLGVVDQIRKTPRGLEAHFALDPDGAAAVAAGWKFPSSFWYVRPENPASSPEPHASRLANAPIRCRPFKLISVALTPFPNISGVESLANAAGAEAPSAAGAEAPSTNIQHPEKLQDPSSNGEAAPGTPGQGTRPTGAGPVPSPGVFSAPERGGDGLSPQTSKSRDQTPETGDKLSPPQNQADVAPTLSPTATPNPEPDMKLIIGWLLAQGTALANTENPTETQVLEALQRLHTAQTADATALGNAQQTLTGQITTLATERDQFRQRADEAATALANEKTARATERQGRAEAVVDLAIQRGQATVAQRDAQVAALANATDFATAAQALLAGPVVVKTVGQNTQSGKQNAGLANEQQQLQTEYNTAFQSELIATGQNPARAHNNIMTLPKYAGLATKLLPKQF